MLGQSGFARARFADDSKALPPLNPEGDSIKGFDFPRGPLVVDVGKMPDFDHGQQRKKTGVSSYEQSSLPENQKGTNINHLRVTKLLSKKGARQ